MRATALVACRGWGRHQWISVDHSWLASKPINQQNPHKIHLQRAESIISVWVLLQRSPMFDCRPSWSNESGPVHLSRSKRGYSCWTMRTSAHKGSWKLWVKFVFNNTSCVCIFALKNKLGLSEGGKARTPSWMANLADWPPNLADWPPNLAQEKMLKIIFFN